MRKLTRLADRAVGLFVPARKAHAATACGWQYKCVKQASYQRWCCPDGSCGAWHYGGECG